MKLIITDSIPTKSFKRSGIFAFDDYLYLKNKNIEVKIIILYRITYQRRFLLNLKKQIESNRTQLRQIRALISNDANMELIPYFSIMKPFVFWEDLFLNKNSRFSKLEFKEIIVHNMLHTGLNVNWIKKQFPETPLVLKEHDNWFTYPGIVRFSAIKRLGHFDRILANSRNTEQSFVKLLKKIGTETQLPKIGVDYPKFKINLKKIQKHQSNCIQILTVANLIKAKGFEEAFPILQIFDKVGINWHWEIIGQGPFYSKIIELAIKFDFLNKIQVIPEVQKPNLYDYMEKADIYLQLSYAETFGIAPIEAFSYYNKLIVSNNITSIQELGLNTNKNVFIINDLNNITNQEEEIINFIRQDTNVEGFETVLPEINRAINS